MQTEFTIILVILVLILATLLAIFALGLRFWKSLKTIEIVDKPTEPENTIFLEEDEKLEDFWKALYKTYVSIGAKKYISLESLKQKLSSQYSQQQFDELLPKARRKYPNKIWIDKDSQGQTIVKINP
jgi:hypothetical protein